MFKDGDFAGDSVERFSRPPEVSRRRNLQFRRQNFRTVQHVDLVSPRPTAFGRDKKLKRVLGVGNDCRESVQIRIKAERPDVGVAVFAPPRKLHGFRDGVVRSVSPGHLRDDLDVRSSRNEFVGTFNVEKQTADGFVIAPRIKQSSQQQAGNRRKDQQRQNEERQRAQSITKTPDRWLRRNGFVEIAAAEFFERLFFKQVSHQRRAFFAFRNIGISQLDK